MEAEEAEEAAEEQEEDEEGEEEEEEEQDAEEEEVEEAQEKAKKPAAPAAQEPQEIEWEEGEQDWALMCYKSSMKMAIRERKNMKSQVLQFGGRLADRGQLEPIAERATVMLRAGESTLAARGFCDAEYQKLAGAKLSCQSLVCLIRAAATSPR